MLDWLFTQEKDVAVPLKFTGLVMEPLQTV